MRLLWQHSSLFLPDFEILQHFDHQTQWGDEWNTHLSFTQAGSYRAAQQGNGFFLFQWCNFDLQGHNKPHGLCGTGRCWSWVSSVRPFVCFFDLLLTTAPSNMCGREPTPPSLNTFPHINKPSRCRNACALAVLLKPSSTITPLFKMLHNAVSKHNDS